MNLYIWVLIGTGLTFIMTALGAAVVFFLRNVNEALQRACLGFAAGIMVAASIWSLLLPALDMTNGTLHPIVPVVIGFTVGGLFIYLMDRLLFKGKNIKSNPSKFSKRTKLLAASVTLHNIPEGMAVGLAFVMAAASGLQAAYLSALFLAVGIALQNFPEGAAISLPLRQEGMSKGKAFLAGALSGAVEPLSGFLMVLLASALIPLMPALLAFAAGAMLYVVVVELIPGAQNDDSKLGVIMFTTGFVLMMCLDVLLG